MNNLHLACGDIYLEGYINCDIHGIDATRVSKEQLEANKTTLDNYFKYPFIEDGEKRRLNKRPFIIDLQMDILERWPFADNSADSIVMISAIEHFSPKKELPHIFSECNRVMKIDGELLIDFPDIKAQVDKYWGIDDEWLSELLYCHHSSQYSVHNWMFTKNTFPKWLGENWGYKWTSIANHSYPMEGVICKKLQ
jgi:predicted SAM-dependent methyltransferase